MSYKIIIGIDTGTKTGLAIWDILERKFHAILTLKIHSAMEKVIEYHQEHGEALFVRFEDARLRTWFQDKSIESLQGAGSIKRDCSIWQDFLQDHKIAFASIEPRRGLTKWDDEKFKRMTGWTGRTSNHSRDAALLVFGYK